MASFLNKAWSSLDVWDKEENKQQRQQFAAQKPLPARAPSQQAQQPQQRPSDFKTGLRMGLRSVGRNARYLNPVTVSSSITHDLMQKTKPTKAFQSGIDRSMLGTGQAFSGLIDLATPGKGTNRVSDYLDTKAKNIDNTVKREKLNPFIYKGAQFAGDTATALVTAGTSKGVQAPKLLKPLAKASNVATRFVTTKTEPLMQAGFKGRVAASTIRNVANPKYQAVNAGYNTLQVGKDASQGKDISKERLVIDNLVGGVAIPAAGAVGSQVAKGAATKVLPKVAKTSQGRSNMYLPGTELNFTSDANGRLKANFHPQQSPDIIAANLKDARQQIADTNAMLLSSQGGYVKNPSAKKIVNGTQGQTKPQALDPTAVLKQEALKYKSAEEFVNGQSSPVYKGLSKDGKRVSSEYGDGYYVTGNKDFAKMYDTGGGLEESFLRSGSKTISTNDPAYKKIKQFYMEQVPGGERGYKKPNLDKVNAELRKHGYDAVTVDSPDGGNISTVVLNKDSLRTRQQLTDIYNQAHTQPQAPVQKPITNAAIPATKTANKIDRSVTKDGNVVGSDPLIQEYADFLRDIGEKNGVDILENGTRVSNNVRSRHLAGVQMSKGDWYDEAVRQIKTGEADQDFLDYYKSAKVAALDSNKKLRLTQDPMQRVFNQNPVNEEATLLQNNRANKQIGMNNAINDNFAKNGAELPDAKVHTEKWYDKMWRDTQSIIERQGKAGQELSGMLNTARDNRELWLADIERRIPTVLKLKGKDFSEFVEATQGNISIAKGSKIEKAVNEWRAVHPEIRQRGVNAGLEIGDLGSTYYPHFVDYDRIFKDKNTYNQAINHLVSTNQAPNAEAAMQLLSQARDVSRNRRFGNLESSRLVDLPFYDKTNNSLRSYLASSAKRITDAETFGPKDENALKLITEAGRNGFDTEAMKNAYDVAVGAKRYGATASKISRGVRQYNTTTKLGLGAMTNIAQNVNTGVVTGHMNTLKNMAKMATPESRKFAHETGVIADAVINDLREQQGYSFAANVLGKGVKAITAPMFGTVEKFNRAVAANAGRDYAIKLAKKGDVKTLRRLGVTGDITRELTLDQQIQAARKIVEKTQFKVDPQDLPGWVDSPGGKLVAQFRSFSYNQGKFFSNEILKPIHNDKNMMPLIRLMAAMPLGYGLYEMRRIIAGQPEEENPTKVALQSFSKIGGAGLASDIYQGINPVGSKYLPSDRRQSMAASSIGGPTVGTAMQGIGALSDLAQRKNTPKDLGRLDGKIAVAKTSDSYTDATPAARFALQQVPIVGTPIKNRVLPFKKESQADTGKLPLEGKASAATATTSDPKELLTAAFSTKQGREMMSLSEEKKKEWAKQSSDNQALYNQYKTMKQRFSPGVKDKDQYSPTELEFKQREAGFQEKGRNTWYKRLDSKYSGLYNSANEVTKAMGVADLPKTNQTVSDFISFNKQYQGAKNDLERGDLQKEFVKKAYRNSLTDTQKYLFGNTYNDSQILAAVDKGIISLDDIKTAVGLDNYMKAKGLSSSLDVSKKVRALIGAASGGSGGSRGRGRTAKGSRRKSKVTSIVMPTYSTANRKMQSLLKSTRA
jgi:hypothetical protein